MTRLWSPEDIEWRAREFRMGDLASEVETWDGEDLHALSSVLKEVADLCAGTGARVADYIDIDLDDLPPAALLAAGIGVAILGMDCGSRVERRAL